MKNILGKKKNLEFYNKKGVLVYNFYRNSDGYCCESTYDDRENELTYKNSSGYRYEYTYDDQGNKLTYENSDGYFGEYTRDDKGKELTFKDSNGVSRGFGIPEYTMEELVAKLGNFKIKKL